jgi:hypothetical protein
MAGLAPQTTAALAKVYLSGVHFIARLHRIFSFGIAEGAAFFQAVQERPPGCFEIIPIQAEPNELGSQNVFGVLLLLSLIRGRFFICMMHRLQWVYCL